MASEALRLLRGRDGWWALNTNMVARLPRHSVHVWTPNAGDEQSVDRQRGLVLVPDAYAALTASGFFKPITDKNYAVTVLTATACNLGCAYCFQNTALPEPGSFAPPRIRKSVLSPTDILATLGFIAKQMKAADLTSTSLLLFGGEPLLNLSGCLGLLRGLVNLNLIDAEIVTNGVLLQPEVASALRSAGLRRIQITFDGDRAAHDQVRVTRNGRRTYDTILENIRSSSAAVPDLTWNCRVNVSHHNVDSLFGLVQELAGAIHSAKEASLHLALIDDSGLGYVNNVAHDDGLTDTFIAVNRAAIDAGLRVVPSKPLSACPYCSAVGGDRGAVINADGTLYSCWENAGRDGWEIGSVHSGYGDDETVQAKWVSCDFDIKPHGDSLATREFLDSVDAAALDDQYARGQLTRKLAP